MHPVALVGMGGAIGSIFRWAVAEAMPAGSGEVPWATIAVNLLGAFLLGILMSASLQTDTLLFFGTGLLGGFTTMSTFGVETVNLLKDDSTMAAGVYLALNLMAPITAWLGWQLSEAFLV
ncbi:MAG: fluoride efflux transporter CrcB [Euryarchaeota archaeon]|nr:fluoride efflux transporter CrcB [Euryarchaeota archaeon]OUW22103.1 MAG: hypothetical protein CBD33_03510 [Euryarchaeota archaeon TMED173]